MKIYCFSSHKILILSIINSCRVKWVLTMTQKLHYDYIALVIYWVKLKKKMNLEILKCDFIQVHNATWTSILIFSMKEYSFYSHLSLCCRVFMFVHRMFKTWKMNNLIERKNNKCWILGKDTLSSQMFGHTMILYTSWYQPQKVMDN